MKKILVRAGLSPFDNFSAEYVMNHSNILGNNSGNMLYAYGVWRALSVEDCTLVPTYYQYNYTETEIDAINQCYDAFVIPLANAFRVDFQKEMRGLTKLIKKLKIPVFVIGVGVNFPFEPELNEKYPFDDTVKEFVKAVLDKSTWIGVRGEITSRYLQGLGFTEGKHMTPIGCPSMYTFGDTLNIRNNVIDVNSPVCFNHSTQAPDNILKFIMRTLDEFPNHNMILQTMKEYKFVYAGASYMYESEKDFPCKRMSDELYLNDRIRFFINVPSWLDFVGQQDFCYGPRLHGNIAAVLSGTPSILFPKDARMRELSEYHGLTSVMPDQVVEKSTLRDFIEKADFQAPCRKHKENFNHYIEFLEKNGLNHIFKEESAPKETPFDIRMKGIKYEPGVTTIFGCEKEEIAKRQDIYMQSVWEKTRILEKENKRVLKKYKDILKKNDDEIIRELNGRLEKSNQKLREQEKILNSKTVQMAMKLKHFTKLFSK